MKKVFLAAAAVLLAVGCQSLRTANYSDEQAIPLEEGRTDSLLLSVSLDYPVKGASQEVLDKITTGILSAAFDLEDGPSATVEETATRYEDNIKDEYFNEFEQTEGKGDILSWEDRINGYFSGKWGHYTSYMIEYYGYRGGAHGMNTMTPIVFDVKTGETVPEEAFFADGFRKPVADLIQARLPEALDNDQEAIGAIFEPSLVGPNGFYEVSKDGVTWYWQPYDIAPYYLGVISVTVPWAELKPYLREN